MYNNNSHFFGMHFIWWFIGVILLFWIIYSSYNIRVKRAKKDMPLDILKKRLASGEINKEEYQEQKKILEE